MKSSRYFLTFVLVYFFQLGNYLFAQVDVEAKELISQKEYSKAYELIKQDNNYPTDAYLQYLLGICYLYSDAAKSSALPAFEMAYDAKENRGESRIPGEVYYYLGLAKHYNYDFNGAMNHFSEYRNFCEKYNRVDYVDFYDFAGTMEKLCQSAVDIFNNNQLKNTIIRPVNFPLNSSYNDYYPVLPSISNQLVYSSNRKSNIGVVNFGQEEVFLEGKLAPGPYHMFYGSRGSTEEDWNIDRDFLTFGYPYIAPVSFSSDGQTLLLLMGQSEEQSALYITDLRNNKWQEPERLPSNINQPKSNIKGASLVANGNRIYFSSNREGGQGGYDIYVTNRKSNNQWTTPENLGAPINTKKNEITPFVSPNMQEIYFSSDGHQGLGYYDVFVSQKAGTEWLSPQNMGVPVNSTYNDICYTKSADGVKEMLSSDREVFKQSDVAQKEAGEFANERNSQMVFSRGNYDIYEVTRFKEKMPLCIVSGLINIKRDGQEVPFYININKAGENRLEPFVFEPDTLGSKYFMVLRGESTYNMNLIYCYDSVKVTPEINRAVYDTLYDFQLSVPKDTYNYEFNADIELQVSKAFDQEIATYIKANSSDFANTHVDNVSLEKELEQIRLDALVLIMDKMTVLGKKEVFEYVGTLESKIEYVQNDDSPDFDAMFDALVNDVSDAIEKTDLNYLRGLDKVMRNEDGLNFRPDEVTVMAEVDKIFDLRNKINEEGYKSLSEVATWIEEEVNGHVEFIYFGEPADLSAQERIEAIKQVFIQLGLNMEEKVRGYIEGSTSQLEQGKIKFILRKSV